MARQSRRHLRQELRHCASGLLAYCALLAGIAYGVYAVTTHPGLIAWLQPERVLGILPPKQGAAEKPHASLPPKLRGALAE